MSLKLHYPSKKELTSLPELREALENDEKLFEQTFAYMEQVSDREVELNKRIATLRGQLNELTLLMDRLSPFDIADYLEILHKEIFKCPQPLTEFLNSQLRSLQTSWNHINFLFFSNAQELNRDSFHANVFHSLSKKIKNIANQNSKQAQKIKRTLHSLQQQCQAAEDVFCGKGMQTYQKLPKKIRLQIEQQLTTRFPSFCLKKGAEEQGRDLLAGAIMASLYERMTEVKICI